ncbi:hypothetical protein ACIBL3_27135 [Kribbella sp. NPDC050124]
MTADLALTPAEADAVIASTLSVPVVRSAGGGHSGRSAGESLDR